MEWPIEFSDQIDVGDKESHIAIITLWTKKEKVIEKLKNDYAIIGQLYSPDEGINALIRNLLANKKIRDIILIGADLSKSGNALVNFFNGDNENIDDEIPKETLDVLRKNVCLHDHRDVKDYEKLNEIMKNIKKKPTYGDSDVFPKKKIASPSTFSSEKAGFSIHEKDISDAWLKSLDVVMRFGTIKKSQYSEEQKEIISLTIVIEESGELSHCFDFSEEDLENYYPQVLTDKKIDDVEYTYGQRLRNHKGIDQIDKIISKLKEASHSRRAVAFTWDVATDYDNEKSPCLNMVHALIQDNELYLTAYFRSNDMYNAWPKNAFALRKLQEKIASELNIKMGKLVTVASSAHIYKSSWRKTKAVLDNFRKSMKQIGDPRGNLILRQDGDEILVIRESPDGKRIKEYKSKTAVHMYKQLEEDDAISMISHALYLGAELQRLELMIKEKKKFMQDSEL